MTPSEFLALFDAAITVIERAPSILDGFVASGQMTPEQRAERLAKVADSRARVGLPPSQ